MSTYGRIKEFNPSAGSIKLYLEQVKAYFTANKIEGAQQQMILLSSIGQETFAKLSDLMAPDSPLDKSYKDITTTLLSHFELKRVEIAERFKFYQRAQATGESIAEYDAALRSLATNCNFKESLPTALWNRFVCGLRKESLRQQLLAIDKLTYDQALEISRANEAAETNLKSIQHTGAANALVQQVHAVGNHTRSPASNEPRDKKNKHRGCYRCGGKHRAADCKFRDAICHFCKKQGHIAKACITKAKQLAKKEGPAKQYRPTNSLTADHPDSQVSDIDDSMLNHVGDQSKPPILVEVSLNETPVQMELDTGAARTIINEKTYHNLGSKVPSLKPTQIRLRTYSGQQLEVLGTIDVEVQYETQQTSCSLLVVRGTGPNLLGRDWLGRIIKLNWKQLLINHVPTSMTVKEVLDKHERVFRTELGKAKDIVASLHLDKTAKPVFCNARQVPYSLRPKVEQELTRLEKEGIVTPVKHSEWAAPIVPVIKPDGSVRICGDYKLTINKASEPDTYPVPRVEDLFAKLAGGKHFTTLDIAHAYQQIPLDEESKEGVTINTHKGLFQYNRLPFGVHSAPAIFQRAMEGLLRDIPSAVVFVDDILVSGKTDEEHVRNLYMVLTKLEEADLTLKRKKCKFMMEKVDYLGHTISAEGLHTSESKTEAIVKAPTPQNVSQLRSFLGMVNYYSKFVNNLSSILAPLYRLLRKKTQWRWGPAEVTAFKTVKEKLSQTPVLAHYDPEKQLTLATDASPYGVGAVLSHVLSDGTEQPVAYASRSLNDAERRYSQLDKEALAIKFGVQRFHRLNSQICTTQETDQ